MAKNESTKIYTIKDVSETTGVHPQTLRNWEKEGLINPSRISGNQRIYTEEDFSRIKEIMHMKNEGFQLKGIRNALLGRITRRKANNPMVMVNMPTEDPVPYTGKKRGRKPKQETIEQPVITERNRIGRPPKITTNMPPVEETRATRQEELVAETQAPKRVGRPPKMTATMPPLESNRTTRQEQPVAETQTTQYTGKKRGRKPKFNEEDLRNKSLSELTDIAQREGVKYFRQMLKDELITSLVYPERKDEMIRQAKDRTRERYGDKVYGERRRQMEGTANQTPLMTAAQSPETIGTVTEERNANTEGLVEQTQVLQEEMTKQKRLINEILELGKTGKSPEEIAKLLVANHKDEE